MSRWKAHWARAVQPLKTRDSVLTSAVNRANTNCCPAADVHCRVGSSEKRLGLGYIGGMRLLPIALLLATCAPAWAANCATCILDKMPGTQNDVAASAIYQVCQSKHGSIQTVAQGSGRGMFGYDSGAECTAKKAGDTRSTRAAYMIGVACRKLYDEPERSFTYEEAFPQR